MTASFAAGGAVDLVPALAIMLGANVGTTLIVQVLSFNVLAVAPLLFLVGIIAFKRSEQTRTRDLARVAIGAGIMLLALRLLLDTLVPAENAPVVRTLLSAITEEPLLCVVIAAALTWAAHSSVAIVLLIMSLGYANIVTPEAALALVIGANVGSAINPVIEGSQARNPVSATPAHWKPDQQAGRLCFGAAVHRPDRSPLHALRAQRFARNGGFPYDLQRGPGAAVYPPA